MARANTAVVATRASSPHTVEALKDDLALAKTIIASAGLKPAEQGEDGSRVAVYDAKGALYEVPPFCCRDPKNMETQVAEGEEDIVHVFQSGGELPDERCVWSRPRGGAVLTPPSIYASDV